MVTSTAHYPTTSNPNIVLDPHRCGGDNRRMFIQCVHYTENGVKCETLGHIFMGYKNRKWTAVFVDANGVTKSQSPTDTKEAAVAKFDKLVAGKRTAKIDRLLVNA